MKREERLKLFFSDTPRLPLLSSRPKNTKEKIWPQFLLEDGQ